MRSRLCVRRLSSALALGLTLAIAAPGLNAAQAESSELMSLEPNLMPAAPSCGVPSALAAEQAAMRTSAAMLRLQQQIEREMAAQGTDFIPLNTQGYGYQRDRYVGPPTQSVEPPLSLTPEPVPARRAP